MSVHGRIFDIKQFAIHDGPGIRTTVFLKGCPLDCWWCHNPESRDSAPELVHYHTKCNSTGECIEACPVGALEVTTDGINIDRDRCTLCWECVSACPSGAIQRVGRNVTVDEILEEVEKSVIFFDSSGGGLTVSGGEPLQQPDFVEKLLKRAVTEGIETTLDTTGYASQSVMDSVAQYVDTFLYDVKFIDEALHETYTGVSNEPILDNLRMLVDQGRGDDVVIRRPVITGINDQREHTQALADYLSTLETVARIDLLPFHDVSEKYERFGKEYRISNRGAPTFDQLTDIKSTLESTGFSVEISGY